MEDKIIEVFKKYSKSVDTVYNTYNCLIEEDWSNIAQEVVKLFRQPPVMPSLPHDDKIIEYVNKNLSTWKISERERILILATIKCIKNGKLFSGNGA